MSVCFKALFAIVVCAIVRTSVCTEGSGFLFCLLVFLIFVYLCIAAHFTFNYFWHEKKIQDFYLLAKISHLETLGTVRIGHGQGIHMFAYA